MNLEKTNYGPRYWRLEQNGTTVYGLELRDRYNRDDKGNIYSLSKSPCLVRPTNQLMSYIQEEWKYVFYCSVNDLLQFLERIAVAEEQIAAIKLDLIELGWGDR